MKRLAATLLLFPFLGACDSTGPAGTAPIELSFATVAPTLAADIASPAADLETAALTIPTDGGAYEITDVQFIVSEFELEGPETCVEEEEDGEVELEECEFEGGPKLVDLPLDGGAITLGTDLVSEGTYTFLKFEVEDVELDEDEIDEDDKEAALAALLTELRAEYPDFPTGASMVVSGEFVPDTGDPQPFTVYFEAEIEVEMPLDPPLEVPTDDGLTVNVDPSIWFGAIDLLAADDQLIEFELEMEDGFIEVKIEDDEDDEDDD